MRRPCPTTESRVGPTHTIVFIWDGIVSQGNATVTEGKAQAGTPTFNGTNEMVVPLIGVISAALILGEPLGIREVVAIVLVLGGVTLALQKA